MQEQETAAESGDPTGRMALAWLPAGDYEQALTLWPDLAGSDLVAGADPDVVSWPPGRNQPCWCGSGYKYKKCCAATPLDVTPS
jgi:uncharacterized protein YecA (UPF0149 family)